MKFWIAFAVIVAWLVLLKFAPGLAMLVLVAAAAAAFVAYEPFGG